VANYPEQPTVLVVEDEPLLRIFLAEELRCAGLDVTEARTGDEARECLCKQKFKAVVTDVRMPGTMNGLELAQQVLRDCPDTAVLIASADAVNAIPPGAHFEPKPFNVPKLVKRVKALVDA
jgi:DNA-binding response OmpR family regulator